MYGAVVKKGLYFSDMIYRILLLSFSDMVDATSRSFDWGLVFRFEGKGPDRVAELRASGALARGAPEQAASGPGASTGTVASGPMSSAPIALGARSSTGRVALAAAPALPAQATPEALPKGPRSVRVAAAAERAASLDALILDLGDSESREIAPSADSASGFVDTSDAVAKLAYADFPRYDSRGISLAAVRAALYFDLLANPDSIYALVGDNFRATVVPYFDEAGRFNFAFFSGGKEASWDELSSGKRELKVRAVRVSQ
jgi:hypothetical protein